MCLSKIANSDFLPVIKAFSTKARTCRRAWHKESVSELPASSPTDAELMALVGQGNEEAFAQIVSRYQNAVYGIVSKMLGPGHPDVEDVAQQVFLRVYKAASRYQPRAKFTTWLYTICRNTVFTHARKARRWQAEPLEYENEEGEPVQSARMQDHAAASGRDEVIQAELEHAVNQAIAALPEKQRMALILRQYEQLDYEEIGRVMDISLASVKSLLFRARDTLRESLKKYLRAT